MADSRFFKNMGPFTLNDLAKKINATIVNDTTNGSLIINDVSSLQSARAGCLTHFHNTKYSDELLNTKASVCIIESKHASKAPDNLTLLIHPKPYRAYGLIANMFYGQDAKQPGISPLAHIEPSAKIGTGTYIGPFTYIGDGVEIGENCQIDSHVTITNSIIANHVRIKTGAKIGQKGFGFHMDEEGPLNIPQLGRVIIHDYVEIGANTTIDRGSEPDTIIGQGTRIDNLVQIGHNVQIGKNCIIIAQVGIAGSTKLGNGVVVAGQAGLAGHLNIGDRVQIAAQSGIMRDIEKGQTVAGSPCVPAIIWHKQNVVLKKLATRNKEKV